MRNKNDHGGRLSAIPSLFLYLQGDLLGYGGKNHDD